MKVPLKIFSILSKIHPVCCDVCFDYRLGWYQMMDTQLGRSVLGRKSCQKNSENCQNKSSQSQPNIRCAVCGHKLVDEEKTEFLNDLISPFAKSVHKMQLFGSENVTVQEFVNPHDYHFHSFQVISSKI